MKKINKEQLLSILISKDVNITFDELANITGYNAKSLIRINSKIKKGIYPLNKLKNQIINEYTSNNYKTNKEFYDDIKYKYNISYSYVCKILKMISVDQELVIIKKIKKANIYRFDVIDYSRSTLLFSQESLKNNTKSLKKAIYKLFSDFGIPVNICVCNVPIPLYIQGILNKYNVKIVLPSTIIKKTKYKLKNNLVLYKKMNIDKRDFYSRVVRRIIDDNNIVQFNNIRYKLLTKDKLPKKTKVILYYNEYKNDIFVIHNKQKYLLSPYKKVTSKKGLTKY